MGRKPAPEPLTLSPSDPRALEVVRSTAAPAVAAPPATTPEVSTASPRSPRSPFRFTPKKSSQSAGSGGNQQLMQLADESTQQQRQHSSGEDPTGAYVAVSAPSQQLTFLPTPQDDPTQQQVLLQEPPFEKKARRKKRQEEERQQVPQLPQDQSQQSRDDDRPPKSSGFFFNFKASKSSQQLHGHHHSDSRRENLSRGSEIPSMPGKTLKPSDSSYADHSNQKPVATLPSKSDLSLPSAGIDYETNTTTTPTSAGSTGKKDKPKQFALLGRTKSVRDKDGPSPREFHQQQLHQQQPLPPQAQYPVTARLPDPPERAQTTSSAFAGLKTAPVAAHDRSFRDMMTSAVRNRSEDRSAPRDILSSSNSNNKDGYGVSDKGSRTQPSSYQDSAGSGFFNNFKSSSSKAANMISKGLFGKGSRGHDREPVVDDEHYVLKIINRPLVEQTRLTRISKRLEDSRDKTEFWMPAFPWRAIDYLNYKGSDVEGLYRVPGSGPQIKKWQRRFDEEYDVDLFAQDDLYDINIIGSMLKAWLRELPDELFPKDAQDRISRECAGAETVPPLLVEELSNLSPFNYYLLFAITCHLSLLLAHSDKNKMDFRNLCICFQPCMKIDAFCFKFLVCDWRDCWKGCKNEARFIEDEYLLFDQPPPRGLGEPRRPVTTDEMTGAPPAPLLNSALVPMSLPAPTQPPPVLPPVIIDDRDRDRDRNVSSSDSTSKQSSSVQSIGMENGGGGGGFGGAANGGGSTGTATSASINSSNNNSKGRLKKKALPLSDSNGSVTSNSTISTTLTIAADTTPRVSGDLRPLSPIKPLSPLGF